MAQNQVSIVVSGRSYTISADADRETLVAAVERVDESITRYRNMPLSDELRAATLSSVIFAYDLIENELKNRTISKDYDKTKSELLRLQDVVNELLGKQNEVLGESGKLRDKADLLENERDELLKLKATLSEEIQQVRQEFERVSIEKTSELDKIILERNQLQKSLSEMMAEREIHVSRIEIAERDYSAKMQDMKDELEYQQLAFEEELETCKQQHAKELNDVKTLSDTHNKEILASHLKAIQVLAEERDASKLECSELREEIESIEQDRDEMRESAIERSKNLAELELRLVELEHFLTSLQEERELLFLERDELLSTLTKVTGDRDVLRSLVLKVENERDEMALAQEELLANVDADLLKYKEEKKLAEAALMKMVGQISSAGITLS